MTRFIARTFVPAQELAEILASTPDETPETRIEGDIAIAEFSNGLRSEFTFESNDFGLTILLKTFDIYGAGNQHLFSMPNFNLLQKRYDFNPSQTLRDYYAQFDGLTLEYSDKNDTVNGDEFFTNGISSALSSSSTLSDALLRELAEKSLIVDFGSGLDTLVLNENRSDILIRDVNAHRTNIYVDGNRIDTFDLERLELNDGTFIFDEDGAYADYTYALFSAALTRSPAEKGFRFWNDVMNSGAFDQETREQTEVRLAEEFVNSDEFAQRFDVETTDGFVTALFRNVLGRDPKQSGFDFWKSAFESGDLTRADMLRYFAISDENMSNIADNIDDGYWVV